MTRTVIFSLSILFFCFLTERTLTRSCYRTPSQELVNLVDGARTPRVSVSPDRSVMPLQDHPSLPAIEEIAQPELRLAGIRINPTTNGSSRPGYVTGFTLRDLETGSDTEITGIPEGSRITNVSWSPDGSYFAFLMITENGLDLWLADVERASARKLSDYKINNTYYGSPFFWTRDSASIVAKTVPENRGNVPEESTIPTGPIIQENL